MQFVNLKIAYMSIFFIMELLNRLRDLCKERGITIAQVERGAGLTLTTIAKWNRITPGIDKVASVELLGRSAPEISVADRQILELFHQLNEDGQGAAVAMLQGLARQPGYIKSDSAEELEG